MQYPQIFVLVYLAALFVLDFFRSVLVAVGYIEVGAGRHKTRAGFLKSTAAKVSARTSLVYALALGGFWS